MPEPQWRIPTRSRRQAMDWSLVLASQDIHPVIAPPGDQQAWSLLVDPADYDRAISAIQQYRLENRGWAWRRELRGAGLEVHSGALFWCLFLALWHWAATFLLPSMNVAGRMDSVAVRHGQWHRLFTAVLLHADLAHLMANATFGVIMLGLAMPRFGPGLTLLAAYAAGVLGNVTGLFLYSRPYTGVGASGMMMGALGLLCIQSFSLVRRNPRAARYVLSGLFSGVLLFILFGVSPGSDILAHAGGFVSGLVFGAVLSLVPEKKLQSPRVIWASLILLFSIIALTWTLAFR
jgi:membrane associated rhomboid family serine protease